MLLCTSQGYQWVKAENKGNTVEQAQEHCQACLFPPNDDSPADLLGSAAPTTFPAQAGKPLLLASDIALIQRERYALSASRAPPFFSL